MVKPEFFDIHSHINDTRFDEDREAVLRNLEESNIWTITVGTDRDMSQKACESTEMAKGVFATIGVHPTDAPTEGFDVAYYDGLVQRYKRVVAIGECGLDYFRLVGDEQTQKKRQKVLFAEQIDFAVKYSLPLMVHTRNAHEDTLDILRYKKREYGDKLWGDIHFFAGDLETAHKYYDLDFTTSVTGVITFTSDYDDVVRGAPLDRIMSETDSPYVAPVPHRGKRNEPKYVQHVINRIIELRAEDAETVKKALVDNAFRVFNFHNMTKNKK